MDYDPPPLPAEFRVENRSERVYIFGFVRMLPAAMWITGIILVVLLGSYHRPQPAVMILLSAIVLVVPILVDRSSLLDPVDYVTFGQQLTVKRLAGKKSHPPDRVLQIEFSSVDGDDYNDRNRRLQQYAVTIRLKHAWRAHLLIASHHAPSIAAWANAHGKKVVGLVPGTARGERLL
jgi:hypothetical protein